MNSLFTKIGIFVFIQVVQGLVVNKDINFDPLMTKKSGDAIYSYFSDKTSHSAKSQCLLQGGTLIDQKSAMKQLETFSNWKWNDGSDVEDKILDLIVGDCEKSVAKDADCTLKKGFICKNDFGSGFLLENILPTFFNRNLSCFAFGNSSLAVTWFRNGKLVVDEYNSKSYQSYQNFANYKSSQLIITTNYSVRDNITCRFGRNTSYSYQQTFLVPVYEYKPVVLNAYKKDNDMCEVELKKLNFKIDHYLVVAPYEDDHIVIELSRGLTNISFNTTRNTAVDYKVIAFRDYTFRSEPSDIFNCFPKDQPNIASTEVKEDDCKVRIFAPQYDDVNQILVQRSNGTAYSKVAYHSSNLVQFKVERGSLFSLSFIHSNDKVGPPSNFFSCELPVDIPVVKSAQILKDNKTCQVEIMKPKKNQIDEIKVVLVNQYPKMNSEFKKTKSVSISQNIIQFEILKGFESINFTLQYLNDRTNSSEESKMTPCLQEVIKNEVIVGQSKIIFLIIPLILILIVLGSVFVYKKKAKSNVVYELDGYSNHVDLQNEEMIENIEVIENEPQIKGHLKVLPNVSFKKQINQEEARIHGETYASVKEYKI